MRVGARARLAQQQVLHVQVGVAAAGVVEAAHGARRTRRAARSTRAFVGRGGEERERVHGAFLVERGRARACRTGRARSASANTGSRHRRARRAQPRA